MHTTLRRSYADLADNRRWYRTECRRLFADRWADLEEENRARLRAEVQRRWTARRAARSGSAVIAEQQSEQDYFRAREDDPAWTEGELREAWGA